MKTRHVLLVSALAFLSMATQALAQAAPEPATAVAGRFVDITAKAQVNFQSEASHTTKKYLPETMGSGIALFDYDNDGLLNISFVNGAPIGP